jgi:putative nucleotidyltransferase with HDIG domain
MPTQDVHGGVGEWVGSLPGLGAAAEVWRSLRSVEDRGLDDAIGLLSDDAVLCEPVLSWCRAGAGVSGDRITSAHRAVIMLGVPAVRAGVLAVSSVVAMGSVRPDDSPIDPDGFWTHAVSVACLCESIAEGAGLATDHGLAPLAGLLHDIGKLGLAWCDPDRFRGAIDEAESRRRSTAACLRDAFGVDHHTVGKQIIQRWGLEPTLRDAVWHSGQERRAIPASADAVLPALVTLAKARARALHLGWSGEFAVSEAPRKGWESVVPGATQRVIDRCERDVLDQVRQRGRAIGIGGNGRGAGLGSGDPVAWSVS